MPNFNEPIAVVGSGCRFPGAASNASKLWDLLRDPRDVQRPIDRFQAESFYNKDGHYHGASNVRSAYLLSEDTRLFDFQFFNIPLNEAEAIDPQQRLLMETVYESLEAAGLNLGTLSGSNTAVYVGVMCDDFSQIVYGDSENIPTYAATGSARSILSNRVSYFFNWHGPSMTIDTACSSSLIAVHQAVQTLRSGESPVAVAAGTNLIFGPTMFVAESNLNMLSPTGRSKMWDASANGYARGEGVGSIVMKTLSAALRDGDHVEYIIRETGVNQDGKTPGITMPSSAMQASLIRDTYTRAGLDPANPRDRCQYFEAHGTGTLAGDPQEAGAIYKAFFADKSDSNASVNDKNMEIEDILYVGSIKTVIGHTEGTAGIAGLMKASLAIQNGMIPPNMNFNTLNPTIEPYYQNLKVPIELTEWPELPAGVPRRASVNSFGFGGANAHAIIEGYNPQTPTTNQEGIVPTGNAPFVFTFSASSEKSLLEQLKSYVVFLEQNPDFSLANLSWSLFRRTALNFRVAFAADSTNSLLSQLQKGIENTETNRSPLGRRVSPKTPPGILGVFTGQGAQWATMGRELITSSHIAEFIIDNLEKSLAELDDGPEWSLKAEMLAPREKSRIAEGVISQPLCTAVQIMTADLLRLSGIRFHSVVGHSSGEIACAYVAGFLSAKDAIRVAYYRGKYTLLAKGGAMIAAGTNMQDAMDLCNLPKLKGCSQLAASNSSASVTISGNTDAIDLVGMIMQDESKFARKLKVDTAYHSFHMNACSVPYLDSLAKCGIQIREPGVDACPWYSSVKEGNEQVTMKMASELQTTYWRDNMLQPVLFSQALDLALVNGGAPGLVIEVGPHPALKGPATLVIEEALGTDVPYFGTIMRGKDASLAMSTVLGSIWTVLGSPAVNLQGFQKAFLPDATFEVSKVLPAYPWDHSRVIWNESRVSNSHRMRTSPTHELLGIRTLDEVEGELRWRNYLNPKEMPWLQGHRIQSQMVLPAAGFAVMAMEASRNLAPFEKIRLMELQDFSIHRALSFMDENAKVETMLVLSNVRKEQSSAEVSYYIVASFSCHACLNKDAGEFSSMASGQIRLTLGEPSSDAMPGRARWVNNFIETNTDYFYDSLSALGYGYTGMFQGVTSLQRTNGSSKGSLTISQDDESAPQNWVIHPATLDVAFQAVFAAVGAPGDGRLWTLHVPTWIQSITVNPSACAGSSGVETPLPFDAWVADITKDDISGDVDLYDACGKNAVVQVQGLHVTPLIKPSPADDRNTFGAVTWDAATPDLETDWNEFPLTDAEGKVATFTERLSLFILRDLCSVVLSEEEAQNATEHQRALLEWARQVLQETFAGKHATCQKAWFADTWELLKVPAERLAKINPLIRLCLKIKERLGLYLRGEYSLDGESEAAKSLRSLYQILPGYQTYNEHLVRLVKQLSFKHRNLKVLEIGTAGATSTHTILQLLNDNLTSYTITDASSANLEEMRAFNVGPEPDKMVFKTLDIEEDPTEQGFVSGNYDLIVASNTLHRTADLEATLQHVRSLLRPGGYLALLEPTQTKSLAFALGGCMREGWFAGIEDYRRHSPLVSQVIWDNLLRDSGFSGIDTATPEERKFAVPFSVMCSMAVNKEIDILRAPLAHTGLETKNADLLIIGGKTMVTGRLVRGLKNTLTPHFHKIIEAKTLTDVNDETMAAKPTTISLAELDEPLFKPFTDKKFRAIVKICDNLQNMLWITVGCRGENPYMNLMVGVGRCLVGEMPSLRLQFLNFDGNDQPTPEVLAHHLLRWQLTDHFSGETSKPHEPLFTIEREMSIQDGKVLIPRYLPDAAINTRLNSGRRLITRHVDQSAVPVEMETSGAHFSLLERMQPIADDNVETITVRKSLLNAIRLNGAGCLHVAVGESSSGETVLALTENNQSIISVHKFFAVKINVPRNQEAKLLLLTSNELLANTIMAGASGPVLVHEPSSTLSKCLIKLGSDIGREVIMTSLSSNTTGVKEIHSSCPDRVLSRTIPVNLAAFVNLSGTITSRIVASRLEKLLPIGCDLKRAAYLVTTTAFRSGPVPIGSLQSAAERALRSLNQESEDVHVIPASVVASQKSDLLNMDTIIDWTADSALPVTVLPAEESIRFRSDRTYFLVGLTGELGLQLTKWMVKRGARYLALTSRNPKVDPNWLEHVQSEGAVVKTYSMDVTNRASVQEVHKQVSSEMPPVAGVANGAMILIDSLFANKTFAEFDSTLRPKVDGTVHLDEVFSQNDLDFFIVFSSLACVSGNMGQTAYSAANAFMCSLISGRRMRGLAGSAINMPGILGLGYLNRDPRKLDRLEHAGYVNISEWDFYQFLSEAIIAGRPDSGMNPEITAGLKRIDVNRNRNPPFWVKSPRFHWLRPVMSSGDETVQEEKQGLSIKSRLAELTNKEGIHNLLVEGLLDTLYGKLKMDPSQRGITPDTAIVELGVDSLLAVDMRSWFTKELGLDMPVLKILGGASVNDLIEDAVNRLPPELVPGLTGESYEPGEEGSSIEQASDPVFNVEATELTTIEDRGSMPDGPRQPAEETEEEPLVVAPLDLPSFEDDANHAPAQFSFALPVISLSEVSSSSQDVHDLLLPARDNIGDVSLGPPSVSSDSEENGNSRQTPITSNSDVDEGEEKQRMEESDSISNDEESCDPHAQLFSHLPQDPEVQPELIKKVPMSYGASRFWFLMQYLDDPTTFNLLCHVKCTGPIRYDDAERCFVELGNRHEAFRTAFFADPERMNEPTMGVLEKTPLRLERRRASSQAEVEAEMDEMLQYEFKLEQGETIRAKMISLDDMAHHVLFGFHHIVMDGFSFNLLVAEINKLYDRQPLQPVRMQFSDFAQRQRLQVADGSLDKELRFWNTMYSTTLPSGEVIPNFPEPLPLLSLAQSPRQSVDNYEYEEARLMLDVRTVRQIKSQCRRHKITTFHFFLGVLRTFLLRHLNTDDLVIGIADANRVDPALDTTMGFMLNLLPLRFKGANSKDAVFKDIAIQAREAAYSALAHSQLPFDALLEKLNIPRSTTHSPLFQVWMDYRPFNPDYIPTMFDGQATASPTVGRNGYDLTLDVNEIDRTEVCVSFRTQRYLYSASATQMLFDSYMRLVKAFASSFDTDVNSVPLWGSKEVEEGISLGRGPKLESDWPETLSHRIADITAQNAGNEAVKDGAGNTLSYNDLQQRVQAISNALSASGIKQGSRVAVFQEPSADWVCSLLAIWHAGGTYIPLDLRSSLPRLAAITQAARPAAIVCHEATLKDIPELNSAAVIVNVSDLNSMVSTEITKTQALPNTPAAILFTSGSTGTPKGVVLRHSAFRNTIEGLTKQYNVGQERVLQQSAFTFDFSLDQILCALVNGGSVFVVPKESRGDPIAISEIIASEAITYTRATPSELDSWITYGANNLKSATAWKFSWGGGEMMPRSLRQSSAGLGLPNLRLYNSYGPAESITCTKTEALYLDETEEDDQDIPAGFPLPNYSVYIVDRNLAPVPRGVKGEILIGGPSLSTGYLNNKKLTESKFISNTYSPSDGRIVYRTGDIGYLREDGALMFHSRITGDTQVKVRGMRVDLQDVESSLLSASQGALQKAVVSVRSNEMLVAHVQFAPDQYQNDNQRNAFLRSLRFVLQLPTYMLPSIMIPLDQMPVNTHGKIDRAAIQDLPLPRANQGRTAKALTQMERRLVEVWKEVVSEEAASAIEVGSHTSFFELGGNSLLLVKLQAIVNKRFSIKLSLVDLFSAATLGAMATKIENAPPRDDVDETAEPRVQDYLAESTTVSASEQRVSGI